jgi:hypothetical protein
MCEGPSITWVACRQPSENDGSPRRLTPGRGSPAGLGSTLSSYETGPPATHIADQVSRQAPDAAIQQLDRVSPFGFDTLSPPR